MEGIIIWSIIWSVLWLVIVIVGFGLGIYVLYLLIKALRIYIKKNS